MGLCDSKKYSGNLFKMSDSELLGIMFGISDNKKDEITWESTYSEEENRFVPKHYFGLNKIDTKIISKENLYFAYPMGPDINKK